MIKDLRRKFIVVAMCSTFAVLITIMAIINIANYIKVVKRADEMTEFIAQSNGKLEMPPIDKKTKKVMGGEGLKPEEFSPETPFSTRYFTVTTDNAGNVILTDTGKIAAVDTDTAKEYAARVWKKNKIRGFQGIYRHNVVKNDDKYMIIFLDCRQDLNSVKTFAIISFSVSMFGLLLVFGLVLFLSKPVFKPVEETYEKQKRFITDANHEIKTPLTIIDANTEVLEMENGENQWTISTRNQIRRLTYLTKQMTLLSKLDEEVYSVNKKEFSISQILKECVENFDSIARTQCKILSVSVENDIVFKGDAKAIYQLFGILIDNAIKYSEACSKIDINMSKKGRRIVFSVYNNTGEIPKGNLDILFERFYRMDDSRNSDTGGSGIGLSVAKAIVVSHKGKINAVSDDGKSLRITVEF